jgi:GTP-binding protein EngB required for normal cell division
MAPSDSPSDFVELLDEANGHEQHLENVFSSRLKPKLDAIELVRSDLTVENIEVPGVVVIGDQSAGKSSVLESLSGINFPRGENTCTRRPCILRMECDNYLVGEPHAYVSNDADLGTTRIPLEEIGAEIQRLTREVAGPGSNIIADPIHVKVVRKVGPTLTLIDLPGITWVNENLQDIHDVIVGMIHRYIKNEQMVILAVASAVADFGNSEALKLAKEVDPGQIRTIGVVTKIDTIQKDSDIALKLRADRESDIRLNLGWIAVRCRTPTEVKEGLSADALRAKEKEYFQTHP